MYEGREVLPNSPLAYVAADVRFPLSPRLKRDDVRDELIAALSDILPIARPEQIQEFVIGPGGASQPSPDSMLRLLDAANRTSALISATSVIIETTHYTDYEAFGGLIRRVLGELADRQHVPFVERIGLRYIDEIRVPAPIGSLHDWTAWVDASLLGPITLSDGTEPTEAQTISRFKLAAENMSLLLRAAALSNSAGVIGGHPLERPQHDPGSVFIIDIDGSWQPQVASDLRPFEVVAIMDTFDQLHSPSGALFRRAITDKLRVEILGGAV